MNNYEKLLDSAVNLHNAARLGDKFALAVESIMCAVVSEWEDFKTLDIDDDGAVFTYVAFCADGKGYTAKEIFSGVQGRPTRKIPTMRTIRYRATTICESNREQFVPLSRLLFRQVKYRKQLES